MTVLRLCAFVLPLPGLAWASGPAPAPLTPAVIAADAAGASSGAQAVVLFFALIAIIGVNGS
jgi:hypothetical protein